MNASQPTRTRRSVVPPPSGKLPASQPSLRESISFTIGGSSCDLVVPTDVIGHRAGRSLVLRLAAHVELLSSEALWSVAIDWPADEQSNRRGTVRIDGDENPVAIRSALHAASAALLREVVS